MPNSGKLVIGAMVVAALVLGSLTLTYHRQASHRVLELWGSESALLIARAPVAEAWRLDPPIAQSSPPGHTLQRAEIMPAVVQRKVATPVKGMSNIRHALVHDVTFDWTDHAASGAESWQYALRFADGEREALLLFSPTSRNVLLIGTEKPVSLHPAAGEEFAAFFAEQFSQPTP